MSLLSHLFCTNRRPPFFFYPGMVILGVLWSTFMFLWIMISQEKNDLVTYKNASLMLKEQLEDPPTHIQKQASLIAFMTEQQLSTQIRDIFLTMPLVKALPSHHQDEKRWEIMLLGSHEKKLLSYLKTLFSELPGVWLLEEVHFQKSPQHLAIQLRLNLRQIYYPEKKTWRFYNKK